VKRVGVAGAHVVPPAALPTRPVHPENDESGGQCKSQASLPSQRSKEVCFNNCISINGTALNDHTNHPKSSGVIYGFGLELAGSPDPIGSRIS
jgi:hypothetical protein